MTTADTQPGTVDLTRDEMIAWGRRFAQSLEAPVVVALSGELGAGKTTLVQAMCSALGVSEPVTSPTFALVHHYRGAATQVFHLDLYRLNSPSELSSIGWDEMLDARAIVLVEWPDRAGSLLPSSAIHLHLLHIPSAPDRRRIVR